MANSFPTLPVELQQTVFNLLDPDDICRLSLAFDGLPAIDWIDVTKPQHDNMLSNTHFCDKLKPDVLESRYPRKLKPSSSSGLPQHRTFMALLEDASFNRNTVLAEREQSLTTLCRGLLFNSKDLRKGLDAPSTKSKKELNIQEDSKVTYAQLLAQGTEYLSTGHIPISDILSINGHLNTTNIVLSQTSVIGYGQMSHISKEDPEIFAECFLGLSYTELKRRSTEAQQPYPGYGGKAAGEKHTACFLATRHIIEWFNSRDTFGYELGYHIPTKMDLQLIFRNTPKARMNSKNSIIMVHCYMANLYDSTMTPGGSRQVGYEQVMPTIRRFAARFWHEQLVRHEGVILFHVLPTQLKMPENLFWNIVDDQALPDHSNTPMTISVRAARETVLHYFGCTLEQMICAMLSLIGTNVAIPFNAVLKRASWILVDARSEASLPLLVPELAVLGEDLRTRIYGLPGRVELEGWRSQQECLDYNRHLGYQLPTVTNVAAGSFHHTCQSAIWSE